MRRVTGCGGGVLDKLHVVGVKECRVSGRIQPHRGHPRNTPIPPAEISKDPLPWCAWSCGSAQLTASTPHLKNASTPPPSLRSGLDFTLAWGAAAHHSLATAGRNRCRTEDDTAKPPRLHTWQAPHLASSAPGKLHTWQALNFFQSLFIFPLTK